MEYVWCQCVQRYAAGVRLKIEAPDTQGLSGSLAGLAHTLEQLPAPRMRSHALRQCGAAYAAANVGAASPLCMDIQSFSNLKHSQSQCAQRHAVDIRRKSEVPDT